MRIFLILPAALVAGFSQTAAHAEDSLDTIVVTATRTPVTVADLGQSITVLDAQTIETRQTVAVSDLLATTPGITVARNGGLGTQTGVFIRGAESDQTVVLIDGVKLNDPASPGGGFNFANLLAGNIRRIEIIRGAQSVLWGSQAIGGVVNILTAPPTEDLQANARLEYGYRDTWQATGNVSKTIGPVAASVGAGYLASDGISAFDETRGGREQDSYDNVGANAQVRVTLSQAISLDLRGWFSRGDTGIDGFPPPDFRFADTAERSRSREFVGYAGLNAALFDGRLKNRLAIGYTNIKRRNTDPTLDVTTTFDALGRNTRLEYQGTYAIAEGWELTAGAEREVQRLRTASPSTFDPAPTPLTRTQRLTSGYANLFAKPFAGFSGTLGIRQDQHSSFGGATSFAASGVYSPNKGRSRLRANYSEGFKAPTPFQLGSEFGNPNLVPEDSKGWEVGGDQQLWGEALSLGATYFRRTTRNQIDFNFCPTANALCDDGRFGFYDNVARTRSSGVELLLSARPVEGLSIDASYTHLNPRNKAADSPNAGNVLVRRPQETFSLSADYRHRSGLAGGVTVTTASDRFIDAANTQRLDGYTTLDLRASYEFYQGLELYGRFDNVLDADYETVDQFGTFGRAGFIGLRAAL